MKKLRLKGVISVAQLIMAIIIIVVLGALLNTMTDNTIGLNQSRNGSTAIGAMLGLLPMLAVVILVVSLLSFATHDG